MLKFKIDATLKSIVEHATNAPGHRATMGDLMDAELVKPEHLALLKSQGYVDSSDMLDTAKIKPALWLVKDHGVYLMSNGDPCQPKADGSTGCLVVYAERHDPTKPGGYDYDRTRDEVGGDDFCEPLDLAFFQRAIQAGATEIRIKVSAGSISMSAVTAQPKRGTAVA